MKGHLTDTQILRMVLLAPAKGDENEHLQACTHCRQKAGRYLDLLSPSEKLHAGPPPGTEERILATYTAMKRASLSSHKEKRKTALRPAFAAGAFIIFIMTVAAGYLLNTLTSPVNPVTLVPGAGGAFINGSRTASMLVLPAEMDTITISGRAAVSQKGLFYVNLEGGSEFVMKGLAGQDTDQPVESFLSRGSLTAEVLKTKRHYTFETGHARVLVTGTRFRIVASGNTDISLREGALLVTALSSGREMSLISGQSCTVTPEGSITLKEQEHAADLTTGSVKGQKNSQNKEAVTGIDTSGENTQLRHEKHERLEMQKELRGMLKTNRTLRHERRR